MAIAGSQLGRTTPVLVIAIAAAVAIMAGLLLVLWCEDAAPAGTRYVPARLVDGRIVPAHRGADHARVCGTHPARTRGTDRAWTRWNQPRRGAWV